MPNNYEVIAGTCKGNQRPDLKIEQEYPELYQYVDETPITIPCCDHQKEATKTFSITQTV